MVVLVLVTSTKRPSPQEQHRRWPMSVQPPSEPPSSGRARAHRSRAAYWFRRFIRGRTLPTPLPPPFTITSPLPIDHMIIVVSIIHSIHTHAHTLGSPARQSNEMENTPTSGIIPLPGPGWLVGWLAICCYKKKENKKRERKPGKRPSPWSATGGRVVSLKVGPESFPFPFLPGPAQYL